MTQKCLTQRPDIIFFLIIALRSRVAALHKGVLKLNKRLGTQRTAVIELLELPVESRTLPVEKHHVSQLQLLVVQNKNVRRLNVLVVLVLVSEALKRGNQIPHSIQSVLFFHPLS